MKKPYQERYISDYFVGVFPPDELNQMIDDSTAKALQIFEETGEEMDWQVIFENKVLVRQIQLGMKELEIHKKYWEGR
jgi:hypothetical protein